MAHAYDFSTNVVPGQDERERGYWRDVGTIDAYYHANMDLIAPHPVFNLYNSRWPVYTYRGAEPPAKVSTRIRRRAVLRRRQLAVRGVDHLRRPRRAVDHRPGRVRRPRRPRDGLDPVPGVRVGPGARLHRCIVDKNVVVPDWDRIGLDAETTIGSASR